MSGTPISFGIAPISNLCGRFLVGTLGAIALSASLFLPLKSWDGGTPLTLEASSVTVSERQAEAGPALPPQLVAASGTLRPR